MFTTNLKNRKEEQKMLDDRWMQFLREREEHIRDFVKVSKKTIKKVT